jgi:16S rRNA (cytosine967-C5)-methyltransferase
MAKKSALAKTKTAKAKVKKAKSSRVKPSKKTDKKKMIAKSSKGSTKPVKKAKKTEKVSAKKPALAKSLKTKAGKTPPLKIVHLKKSSAPKIEPPKAEPVDRRPILSLTNPFKDFMEVWKPKNEGFISGIKNLFLSYMVPGKSDKEREKNAAEIIEKIEVAMRKDELSPDLLELLAERFSKDRIRQLAAVMSMKGKVTIRLNTLKADILGFSESKTAKDLKMKRTKLSPWSFEVGAKENPMSLPVYERGIFEVEDEASQLATLLLNARPGQRVLDICAREGDHSLGIGAMMRNKGSLFVYDSDPQKLRVLKQRAQRAGIENIRILNDTQIGEVKSLDLILVDAPSSGTGLLARQPELKWRYRKEDLPKIQKVQAALLREAARKLKLGGRLVYCTSSLSITENEAQIEHFLKSSHNSFRVVPAGEYLREYVLGFAKNFYNFEISEEVLASCLEYEPYFLVQPDVHACGGFFAAVIERTRISN